MNKRWGYLALAPFVVLALAACESAPPSADQTTSKVVEDQQKIYTDNQPVPVYDYSATRDALVQLYNATVPEMRPAWFVFMTPGVGATDSCAGVGVPLPYSTQLTNPSYLAERWYGGSRYVDSLPQPEPDGTYKPDNTQGTWVLCDFGNGIEPVYTEDQVRAYFHPVEVQDGKIVHKAGKPSITITLKTP